MEPSLFERIGGAAGVRAAVQVLHERADADPADRSPARGRDATRNLALDEAVLTAVLYGRDCVDAPASFLARSSMLRHLHDALWLLGTPATLVDEVAAAVEGAAQRLHLLDPP
jgi:hypothetical protein